ncbi:MAG TPA: DHA2 family efflux MFS transporter permease subunit, partial [Gemmatimonadaceae bacterium]|nr:DHA2 family efflux MFS transporter permease subunit [Gemmatimonadaceae bacterium]
MATAAAVPANASESEELNPYRWIILGGLITAAIMEVLDTTIVNVALPQMAGNLGATLQEIGWVLTGYILSNVVVLPMTAFLTETFGRKNYLTASIIIFVVASFLCGTSTSLTEIVVWRIVQGAGGAALLSTAQATIRQIFPRDQQGMVQAIFILGIIVAPTLGPTLGGWITDNYSWNWCFFINIPIGIVSAFLVSSFLHDPPGKRGREGGIDFVGILLLMVGVGSLQYVLEEGNRNDWFSDPLILRLSVLSGICLVVMLWWEL